MNGPPMGGRTMYLRRAVDSEGEVLDMLVQRHRGKRTALRLLHRLLKMQGIVPEELVTDRLRPWRCRS
jgi:putative transposase